MVALTKYIFDLIFPGDKELDLPSASEINLHEIIYCYHSSDEINEFVGLFKCNDTEIRKPDKGFSIDRLMRKNARLAIPIIKSCMTIYYSCEEVLRVIQSSPIPLFPEGCYIEESDWTILEPVYEKGKVFREVNLNG